ncbi:MAG: NAD(P)-dependent oxidoreductase [Clostridia bacterium]|nr:NAD(P)-dependent oxidoreductase [Clostridia bacterium]
MKMLITGAFKATTEQVKELEKNGFEIIFMKDEREKIMDDVSDIEFVICNSLFLYNDITNFKSLKCIQLTSAGLDRVPIEYIKENNIKLFSARGVYSIPMAEWTVLKILEIYKNSFKFYESQKNKEWIKRRDVFELNGKKATIIGFGDIGNEIAKRLKAFNVEINVVDIVDKQNLVVNNFFHISEIEKALEISDIIILTLPLTKETQGIIDIEKINKMKDDSILINVSRGKIIKEQDLIKALENNKFLGVALDVFEEEPLNQKSKLWDFENIIITPHNSFVSEGNNERMWEVIYNNVERGM